MTDAQIQELKDRAGKSVYKRLVRRQSKEDGKGGFRGVCPIHRGQDATAFSVFKKAGEWKWHCHTECNEGGDVIKFVRRLEGMEFPQALSRLRELLDGAPHTVAPETSEPETDEPDAIESWPSWLPLYPTEWQPISQNTRDAIAAKRKDYTPGLQVMRGAGVVEAKGKFVAFPCKVGEELRNLRVLDFIKPKEDWVFWQFRPGPAPGTKIPPDTTVVFAPFDLRGVDPFSPLYLVEGQWDALTMKESGFQTVALLNAGQPSIAKDVLKHLETASFTFLCPDHDSQGTGDRAADRLAPLFPAERTSRLSFAQWNVKDACALRSKCATGEGFKGEIESISSVIEDGARDAAERPQHAAYLDRLQTWDGSAPVPILTSPAGADFLDMPEEVLDTRLGEICRTRMPADLPRAYAWSTLVTVAANLVPECEDLRANLYSCLVGEVGTGKTTALDYACALLSLPDEFRKQVLAGSTERLIPELNESNGAPRMLDVDELGYLLTKAQIDRASFPYVLSSSFYKTRFTMASGRGTYDFNCRLSLVGGVVTENFSNVFGTSTAFGLYDRILFALVQKPDTYLRRPVDLSPAGITPVAVSIDPSVWDERDKWIRENPEWKPRVVEICLRVALICASIDGRSVLYGGDLRAAKALCAYQHRVRLLLKPSIGENPDARCAEAILAWFDGHPGLAVKARDLSRSINANRYGPSVFKRASASLHALEELVTVDGLVRRR